MGLIEGCLDGWAEGDAIGCRVGRELVGLEVGGLVSPGFVGLLVTGASVGDTEG